MAVTQSTDALTREAPLRELASLLQADDAWRRAMHRFGQTSPVALDNVWGALRMLAAAALHHERSGLLLLVASSNREMEGLAEDWALFSETPLLRFPAWSNEAKGSAWREVEFGQRLQTVKRLSQSPETSSIVVLASIQGLLQPTIHGDAVRRVSRELGVGDEINPDELKQWLTLSGFQAVSAVELPGEFAVRGGVIDVFALDWDYPVRIELFDTEIESLRRFDVATQRSLSSLNAIQVTNPTGAASDQSLSGLLPDGCTLLLIEPDEVIASGKAFIERLGDQQELYSLDDELARLQRFPWAGAWALNFHADADTVRLPFESVERFSGEIGRVRQELDGVGKKCTICLVAQNQAEAKRHRELLEESAAAKEDRLKFVQGGLTQGFRMTAAGVVVMACRELLAQDRVARRSAKRGAAARPLESFRDLNEGDLVVHLGHGIGRYRGMQSLEQEGKVADYLAIEFHGGTRIYVPTARMDLIQKYVGGGKTRPTLSRIGGKSWLKQKKAAESAATDIAAEMLELQAVRAARPGVMCGPDSEWQLEFDSAFPYVETPDQVLAIEAIKRDMESPRPMDRLLCGDVGFGKTEVAMRAIFKAVDNGYQAAIMAPTTILAEQHYHTLRDRMAAFPIDIGKLSRFCSTKEQRETMAGVAAGKIDVVVGTHRVASKDVKFHNLGLIVIDEEQRFGVAVKERLKSIRSSVDVLTMSATPIPRTLHMALVGVRDISNLETPPQDRVPVETRVTRFDDKLIRRAIMRELGRGGQIYFVHNRVQDIQQVAERLRGIAPEASLDVAHGQMPEDDLERVMVEFVQGKFDLLLATTIVESGLDIPSANTIFIDDADHYGLSDLHQLRGRVGRYKHRAACYLLLNPRRHITPTAGRRLRAIEEYSQMGAGFAIAMRDLEIRGAGNLLGSQQSGHIAAVGYEFYCHVLENAVRRLKKLPPNLSWDVEIELPGEAFLPDDYINDIRLKIDLYRRLAKVNAFDELEQVRQELRDRFGPLPPPAERMLELVVLRLLATIWQISGLSVEGGFLAIKYASPQRIEQLKRRFAGSLRIADRQTAYVPLVDGRDADHVFELAKSLLRS